MMEFKGTPGPWRMAASPSSIVGWPIVSSDGGSIASLAYLPKEHPAAEEFNKRAVCNGRLIEAAPMLLMALEGMLAAANPPDRGGISLHEWDKRLKAASNGARAALSRALTPEEES